jgi:hypothetical protein
VVKLKEVNKYTIAGRNKAPGQTLAPPGRGRKKNSDTMMVAWGGESITTNNIDGTREQLSSIFA